MDENSKEKLREMSTRLLGMEMRLKTWIDSIHMEMHRITMERNAIHNLVETIKEIE